MAAPRATQFIALRNLARGSQQVRQLHMTGPATYASPILTKERPIANFPRDIAGLRAECKRRKIDASGSQSELISRLNADELVHSRAFSTVIPKRPTVSDDATAAAAPPTRHFNTSRALKAVNDTSTIDFAFLPDVASPSAAELAAGQQVRVPIIPTYDASSTSPIFPSSSSAAAAALDAFAPHPINAETPEPAVMKPEISAMSADAVFLPMADLTDGHAMNVDFHALADRVAANLRRIAVPVDERAGVMKQIWNDMVDDLMAGVGKKATAAGAV